MKVNHSLDDDWKNDRVRFKERVKRVEQLADANGAKAIAKEHLKRDYERIEEVGK